MADIRDLFGPRVSNDLGLGAIPNFIINNQEPGNADTGGITGTIIDLFGRVIGGLGGVPPGLPSFPPAPGGTPPLLPGRIPPAALAPGASGCLPNPCCSGKHLNKTTGCDGAPPGTKCVSNRRMDPLNPKALRRAIRRAKGFERFVKSNRKSLRSLAKI